MVPELTFAATLEGLRRGDFSRLESAFVPRESATPAVVQWHAEGLFDGHPTELAEALTCASFLGAVRVVEYLLAHGVDPAAGDGTGLNAFHWAANRGQLAAVQLLLRHRAPLEARNAYGGTVLGGAVWAAIHEPKPAHLEIIETLLAAGADSAEAEYPASRPDLDALLSRYQRP